MVRSFGNIENLSENVILELKTLPYLREVIISLFLANLDDIKEIPIDLFKQMVQSLPLLNSISLSNTDLTDAHL